MRNLMLFCLVLVSANTQAQKYKGWYLGVNAGVGHTYYHNKNFDYIINTKGNLGENDFYNGVIYKRADKIFNSYQLSLDAQHHLKNGNTLGFGLGYAFQKSAYHIGTTNNSGLVSWYPSELHMDEFSSTTKLNYFQAKFLIGRTFGMSKKLQLETKIGCQLGFLLNFKQNYYSERDTFNNFLAFADKDGFESISKTYNGQEVIHRIPYYKTYKPFNSFVPGLVFECNLIGKLGAGKGQFEKWRYKIGIYGNADLKNVEGNATNWFMPPQNKYPNAPSLAFRGGIQFGLYYHFNKR